MNYSSEELRRVDLLFDAGYDSSTEAVRSAILEAASQNPRILDEPASRVVVSRYKDSSIEYKVMLWCRREDYWDIYYDINERVRERFAKNGVTMSYNHLNVHIMQ